MKILKKCLLLFVTLLMMASSFSTTIIAEDDADNETIARSLYQATCEFVMDNGGELPDEVLALLPDPITDLEIGDKVIAPKVENKAVGDNEYTFLGWNINEIEIIDSDVKFIGTWHKEQKQQQNQEEEPVFDPDISGVPETEKKHKVYYFFVDQNGGSVPDDIMKLLPEKTQVDDLSELDVPDLEGATVGRYEFLKWDSAINLRNNEIYFMGIWKKASNAKSIPYPGYDPDAVVTSQYKSYGISGTTTGYYIVQYLNGELAFCVEPWEHTYALERTSYWITGSISSREAEIIYLGLQNGMSIDAIQAALWNYIEGGHRTVSSGENTDPNSDTYNSNGALQCWGNKYETQDYGGTTSIQSLAKDVGCRLVAGKLKLKKVSSDPNYPYGTYTNNYSLANAVYGVYSDQACTNEVYTLTTNANGDSNTLEFNNDVTYYVKEKTPSKGFKIDTTIYTARVTRGNTVTITSREDPYFDPIVIVLTKKNIKHPDRVKYLDEAEFTVSYYDTQEDDVSNLTAKKSWVFKSILNDDYDGKAVVILDSEHYVRGDTLPLDVNGKFYLPLGTFTIQETKAPQCYQIDPNIYVGHIFLDDDNEPTSEINGGDYLEVENEDLTQSECEVILSTTAIFEENGEHRYVADGVAHIVDTVEYDFLVPGEYYKLKAKLMQVEVTETLYTQDDYDAYVLDHGEEPEWNVGDLKECTKTEVGEVAEAEVLFVPEEETGTQDVVFDGIDFDDRANTDYVVYEYLYHCEVEIPTPQPQPEPGPDDPTPEPQPEPEPVVISEEQVTYHEDLYDEGQSVHVDELYRAAFVLYKISEGNRSIKLSGAYFNVTTHRVKRDGREVDHDLGTYVTGGIYIPGEDDTTEFSVKLYRDPQPTIDPETGEEIPPASTDPELVGEYTSELNTKFKVQAITVLGLEDGIYYTQMNDEPMVTHYVSKGMIFLPEQEEDTQITFTELVAPAGYVMETKPFTMTVGHDYTLERVENFRSNYFPYVPVTGYDG